MKKEFLFLIMIFFICCCVSTNKKYSYSFEFFDMNHRNDYSIQLFKLNESILSDRQISMLDSIKSIAASSIIIPFDIHYKILYYPDYPHSPPADIKFVMINSDSLKIFINPVKSPEKKSNLVYSNFMQEGYYSMQYSIPDGVYDLELSTGNKVFKSKMVIIR
jgi:hypothetical protein